MWTKLLATGVLSAAATLSLLSSGCESDHKSHEYGLTGTERQMDYDANQGGLTRSTHYQPTLVTPHGRMYDSNVRYGDRTVDNDAGGSARSNYGQPSVNPHGGW